MPVPSFPSPALHLAALRRRSQVVTSLTITEVNPSLARTLQGSGMSISPDGLERLTVRLASSSQLSRVLTATEKEGAEGQSLSAGATPGGLRPPARPGVTMALSESQTLCQGPA